MDKLLESLMAANLLTAETKEQLQEAFTQHIQNQVNEAREQEEIKVRAELTEQWISERELLIEAIDSKIEDMVKEELQEFKSDVERFRDLEAEYAAKIVEQKQIMAVQLKEDMATLVNQLDEFLDVQITREMNELQEDLQEAKKEYFGRHIFETFKNMFQTNFHDEDAVFANLEQVKSENKKLTQQLATVTESHNRILRKAKMDELLSTLSGNARSVMETILETTELNKLQPMYDKYISHVLGQSINPTTEKENKVLAEGDVKQKTILESVVLKTGIEADNKLVETSTLDAASKQALTELAALCGTKA